MLFVGDWALGQSINHVKLAFSTDFLVLNLEGSSIGPLPISESFSEERLAKKLGPLISNSILPIDYFPGLCSLANNHFMDYGQDYALKTIQQLNNHGVQTVGFGKNIYEARRPFRTLYGGLKISMFSISETQFGGATAASPGIAQTGDWIFPAVASEVEECDYLIILFHGGLEDASWSAPWTQALFRSLIDVGVNMVVAHHPHKPQGFERYNGGEIYYSLGNFVVDLQKWVGYPFANYSLGVDLQVLDGHIHTTLRYFESIYDNRDNSISVVEIYPNSTHELSRLQHESNRILQDSALNQAIWVETCVFLWNHYLKEAFDAPGFRSVVSNKIKKFILFLFDNSRFHIREHRLKEIRNRYFHHFISNESHRNIILGALADYGENRDNPEAHKIVLSGLSHLSVD